MEQRIFQRAAQKLSLNELVLRDDTETKSDKSEDVLSSSEVKKMLQHLGRLDDPSIAVDVVRADILRAGRIDLECALELLSILRPLLGSTYEEHALAALRAVSQLSLGDK